MKNLFKTIFITFAAAAALVSCTPPDYVPEGSQNAEIELSITNLSGENIYNLYVRESGDTPWENATEMLGTEIFYDRTTYVIIPKEIYTQKIDILAQDFNFNNYLYTDITIDTRSLTIRAEDAVPGEPVVYLNNFNKQF